MTATETERNVGVPDALETRARLIAAARGENLESLIADYLREYVRRETGRLRRCRSCGIRVRREDMVYDARACSEDCADDLWIEAQFGVR